MSQIKKLASQTAIYGLSSILGRMVNFLLVPFYTQETIMTQAEYGIISEYYVYVAFFNIVFQFGMETTYFRWANKIDEKKAFNNSVSLVLLLSGIMGTLLISLATPITDALGYKGHENFIYVLTTVVAMDAIFAIPFARLRHKQKAKKFAIIRFTNIGLNIFLNFFFLLICKNIHEGSWLPSWKPFIDTFYIPDFEIGYVFIANLLANSFFVPMLLNEFKGFRFELAKEHIRPMMKFTTPLIIVGLAGMVNEMIDRILLKYLLDEGIDGKSSQTIVGIYSACYKLSMFIQIVVQAFRYAADPFFFSKAKDKNSPELFAKVMKWFIIACTFIYLGVSLERNVIGYFMLSSPSYHEGLIIVPLLLLANVFLGVYYNQSIWYKLSEKTYFGSMIGVIGALITLIINILLIPYMGYLGSAIATLVCYLFMMIISYFLGQKHYPIPYKVGSAFFYIISSSAIVVGSYFIKFSNLWIEFFVMGAVFAGFVAVTIWFERHELKSILKR